MGFFQKRHFRSFLQFVSRVRDPEFNPEGDAEDLDGVTMKQVYERFWLDENSQDFTGHAMALQTDDSYKHKVRGAGACCSRRFGAGPLTCAREQRARETVRALKLYAYSLDTYGKTPFIYPMYGLGGLPEGFSRCVHSLQAQPAPRPLLHTLLGARAPASARSRAAPSCSTRAWTRCSSTSPATPPACGRATRLPRPSS